MDPARRQTLALGAGAAMAVALPGFAWAEAPEIAEAIEAFTGGVEPTSDGIKLDVARVAENGYAVPITISAPGAREILLIAPINPEPVVARIAFGALSGSQATSTRIRMAGTQNLIAMAKFSDGSIARTERPVIVTIGGCGSATDTPESNT